MLNIATDLNNTNTEITRMFNGGTLRTLRQQNTLRRLQSVSTNSPSGLLGASKDHINRRKRTKCAEGYSDLRDRTDQVADKNFIMRNVTIFNFCKFTHRINGKVKNDWRYICTAPV